MELPLATWAVLGMTIARAQFTQQEWRAELSLTEMQRRLGGAGRKTVVGAVGRLEKAGLVRAIRRRRNRRFSEVNVYVLEHPEAVRAAPETPWREDGLPQASAIASEPGVRPPASPGAPERAPEASRAPEPGKAARPLLKALRRFWRNLRGRRAGRSPNPRGPAQRPAKAHGRLPVARDSSPPGVHPVSTVHPNGLIVIERKILLQNYR